MKTNCVNCAEEFESDYPSLMRTYLEMKASYPDCDMMPPTIDTYCPVCTKEARRLQQLIHRQMLEASNWVIVELKRFGEERRREKATKE